MQTGLEEVMECGRPAGEEEGLEEDFHGYRAEKCSSVFFEDPPLQKFVSHEILSNDAVSELIFV